MHQPMVGGVLRKCSTTWMTEVRVKGKGMHPVRGQEVEGRVLDTVIRGMDGRRTRKVSVRNQAKMDASRFVKEGVTKCC